MIFNNVIRKAWVSEKATDLSRQGKYIFLIDAEANASEAKKEVERLYNVKVVKANIVSRKGKTKRLGRSVGRRPDYKKFIATLAKGQSIEIR